MVEPIFNERNFSVSRGAANIYEHVSQGSGKKVFVHFCAKCGTKLFLKFERFAEVVGVYGGTFDNPSWFELTPENSKHIFLGVARRGSIIPSGLNTFHEHSMTAAGTPIEPTVFMEPRAIQ